MSDGEETEKIEQVKKGKRDREKEKVRERWLRLLCVACGERADGSDRRASFSKHSSSHGPLPASVCVGVSVCVCVCTPITDR